MYLLVPFIMPRDIVDELNLIRNTLPIFRKSCCCSFTVLLTAAKPWICFEQLCFIYRGTWNAIETIKKDLRQYCNLFFQLENSTAIQTTSYAKILMELISIFLRFPHSPDTEGHYRPKEFFATESVSSAFKRERDLSFRSVVVILRSCTIWKDQRQKKKCSDPIRFLKWSITSELFSLSFFQKSWSWVSRWGSLEPGVRSGLDHL